MGQLKEIALPNGQRFNAYVATPPGGNGNFVGRAYGRLRPGGPHAARARRCEARRLMPPPQQVGPFQSWR